MTNSTTVGDRTTVKLTHPTSSCQYVDCIQVLTPPESNFYYGLVLNVTFKPIQPGGFLSIRPRGRINLPSQLPPNTRYYDMRDGELRLSQAATRSLRYQRLTDLTMRYHVDAASPTVPADHGYTLSYRWEQSECCRC